MQNLYSTTMVIIQTKMLFWFQMTMIILVMMMILMSFEAEETATWLQIVRMFFHSRLTKPGIQKQTITPQYIVLHTIVHTITQRYPNLSLIFNGNAMELVLQYYAWCTLVFQWNTHWYFNEIHIGITKNTYGAIRISIAVECSAVRTCNLVLQLPSAQVRCLLSVSFTSFIPLCFFLRQVLPLCFYGRILSFKYCEYSARISTVGNGDFAILGLPD